MKINSKKTKVLVCIRKNNTRVNIYLHEYQELEQIDNFTYLGKLFIMPN